MLADSHADVDALVLCSEERVYERDAVLGRDARSVFPTEISKQAAADRASAAESVGGRNFITESEVGWLHCLWAVLIP